MPSHDASASTAIAGDCWGDIGRQARALASALQSVATGLPPQTQVACLGYASLVEELAGLASSNGTLFPSGRRGLALTRKQLQDFGLLLRDKRNRAGFSRVQLARRAKLSDATIKFIETARHPPSRASLLRLVSVAELDLRWAETPLGRSGLPDDATQPSPRPETEFSRYDSRLTLPLVLEALLVLDQLRAGFYVVEVTAYGARRACCLCGARSEAWTLDSCEAATLPLQHSSPCAGRLVEALWLRFPVLSELAHEERNSLTATAPSAARGEPSLSRPCGARRP